MKNAAVLFWVLAALFAVNTAKLYEFSTNLGNDGVVKFLDGTTERTGAATNPDIVGFLTGVVDTETKLLLLHATFQAKKSSDMVLFHTPADAATLTHNLVFYKKSSEKADLAMAITTHDASNLSNKKLSTPLLYSHLGTQGISSPAGPATLQPGFEVHTNFEQLATGAKPSVATVKYASTTLKDDVLCAFIKGETFVELDWGQTVATRIRGNLYASPSVGPEVSCERLLGTTVTDDYVVPNRNVDSSEELHGPKIQLKFSNLRGRDPK